MEVGVQTTCGGGGGGTSPEEDDDDDDDAVLGPDSPHPIQITEASATENKRNDITSEDIRRGLENKRASNRIYFEIK